ncbi:serine protease 30-like [Onthophagus taurus]|uniref:serine protease 30-like n=1 Tax=Onthophagus taurus TaxID=166361 RepID=UPI0039BDEB0F
MLVLSTVILTLFSFSGAVINFSDVSCGKQTLRFGKIVGGRDAQKHEFPWMVSITRRGGHFCGGTLITNQHVLTAAHCLCTGIGEDTMLPATIKATISQHDLTTSDTAAYEVGVNSISVHPQYSCKKARNDIAIIELASKVQWSDSANPACLPSFESSRLQETIATVAGWGWTKEHGRKATTLQKANVNIVDKETCQSWYASQGKKTKIQSGQICAGYEQGGIDSCWADSGGPLMVHSEGRVVVVGVVSTGIGCARPFLPGLYTNVADYVDWIKTTIH